MNDGELLKVLTLEASNIGTYQVHFTLGVRRGLKFFQNSETVSSKLVAMLGEIGIQK